MKRLLAIILCSIAAFSCGHGGAPNPGNNNGSPKLVGHVVNGAGQPEVGAAVQLSMLSSTTDADGRFSFQLQAAGSYNLSIQGTDGVFLSKLVVVGSGETSTELVLDPSPADFSLVNVSPPLNSNGASLIEPITLSFSRQVNPALATTADFTFTPSVGEYSLEIDGASVMIHPMREMALNQRYRLRISGVTALDGSSLNGDVFTYFTTTSVDTLPPEAQSATPSNGATGIPLNQVMEITYSDRIAPLPGGFTASIEPAAPIASIDAEDNVLRISLVGMLSPNTNYVLHVGSIQDLSGNVSSPITVLFRTGNQVVSHDDIEPAWNVFADAVVFARSTGGRYDLYSIAPDGSHLNRLTDTAANERHPTFSSDGSLIAYSSDASGNWDIWVRSFATGEASQLTFLQEDETAPAFCGTFSQLIAFVRRESEPATLRIYLMNSDGSFSRRADESSTRDEWEPAFHPLLDNQMLYTASEGGDYDIFSKSAFIDSDQPVNADLTQDMTGNEYAAAYSADGSTIAFISDQTGVRNVWVMDPAGSAHYQVTRFDQPVHSLSYSPVTGDDRVVISMGPANARSLYIVSLVSGTIERRLTE
jgi:hypothetical protein